MFAKKCDCESRNILGESQREKHVIANAVKQSIFTKTVESTKIFSDFIESTKDSNVWIKASCNDENGKIPHKTPNSRNDNSIVYSSGCFA